MSTEPHNLSFSIAESVIVAGRGLFFAWYLILVCLLAPGFPRESTLFSPLVSQFVFLLSVAIATLALSRSTPAGLFNRRLYSTAATVVAAVAACMPCILVLTGIDVANVQLIFAIILFVSGAGAVYFFSAWEDLMMECGPGNPVLSIAVSFTLGALLFVVSFAFSVEQAAALSALFLLASASALVVVGRTIGKSDEPSSDPVLDAPDAESARQPSAAGNVITNVTFFIVSVCCGLVLALCTCFDIEVVGVSFLVGAALCAVFAGLLWLTKRTVPLDVLERVIAGVITVAAILILAVRSPEIMRICACAVLASWVVFRAYNVGLLMNKAIRSGQPSVRFMAMSNASVNMGLAVGCLGAVVFTCRGFAQDSVVLCCAIASILLVVFCFAVRPSAFMAPEGSNSFEELMQKCLLVAETYRLSPREGEILCYLARGRSAKRISEELVVSEHTVKSHVYRIYKKLGVHSRQELIDKVEEGSFDL